VQNEHFYEVKLIRQILACYLGLAYDAKAEANIFLIRTDTHCRIMFLLLHDEFSIALLCRSESIPAVPFISSYR
jgi:hypothetical protein